MPAAQSPNELTYRNALFPAHSRIIQHPDSVRRASAVTAAMAAMIHSPATYGNTEGSLKLLLRAPWEPFYLCQSLLTQQNRTSFLNQSFPERLYAKRQPRLLLF